MPSPRRTALRMAALVVIVPALALPATTVGAAVAPIPVDPGIATETGPAFVAPSLRSATGSTQVVVQLDRSPLAASVPEGSLAEGTLPGARTQRGVLDEVAAEQDRVSSAARKLGARERARISRSLNALVVDVDASRITDLARIPGVLSVRPVRRYQTATDPGGSGSLAQAATYLQVDALRAQGLDGTGIKVAVIDSGIDYTHANLGGPGTAAFYASCYGDVNDPSLPGPKDTAVAPPCDAYFGPAAARVKGGIDLIGDAWPNSPEAIDPNPIDFEGHGTHVADIIAGNGPGHAGLAPGASLYAVKVCSAVATACSGLALLQAVDWSLDPNGDGDLSDAMDLMNLSLGSDYAGDEDDLSYALNNAVRAGITVVASAGNGGDRPFKVGSPSAAERVISVAQTTLPDDVSNVIEVTSPANVPGLTDNRVKLTVLQPWGGPIPAAPGLVGDLVRPTGSALGCAVGDFGPATAGRIALVDRGTCAISIKASNAQAAGAIGFILANNTGGAPGAFSYGGGVITIPALAISQSEGAALRSAVTAGTVSVAIDPSQAISLANTMVASSSRGPSIDGIRVKPDIGAPGAWQSAEVGTGDGQTAFGGTSGAAPTVSGVTALLLQRFPRERPAQVKARLLNSADTHNRTPDPQLTLYPTPVSRIGAGEVRALPAVQATFRLRNAIPGAGNLALGAPNVAADKVITRDVELSNLTTTAQAITVAAQFRDPADEALGAVEISGGGQVVVPARATITKRLTFTIRADKLPTWAETGRAGIDGADGTVLNGPEFDGLIVATNAAGEAEHLAWHVLPQRSAAVTTVGSVSLKRVTSAPVTLANASPVLAGTASVYALTGTSPKQPTPAPGAPGSDGSNVALIDLLQVGVRTTGNVVQVAIVGNGLRSTPLYPAGYEVDVDTNRDGTPDYYIWQEEQGGFGASGRSVVYVQNATSGVTSAYYYAVADFMSGAIVYTVPASVLGLAPGESFDFSVLAYDNEFSGLVTDSITGMTFTPGAERYTVTQAGNPVESTTVPASGSTTVTLTRTGATAPSTQTGVLFLYDDAAKKEAGTVLVRQ